MVVKWLNLSQGKTTRSAWLLIPPSVNSGIYGDRLWCDKIDCDLPQLLKSWWNIMTLIIWPYILIWPTSKLHNPDTILLMCHKVSPTLWVVIMFYNSFINSHCVIFMYLYYEPFVTRQGYYNLLIYYTWIELIITGEGSHNLFNILCWHQNHYKISKTLGFMVINYNMPKLIVIYHNCCNYGETLYPLPYSYISSYDRPQSYTILIQSS